MGKNLSLMILTFAKGMEIRHFIHLCYKDTWYILATCIKLFNSCFFLFSSVGTRSVYYRYTWKSCPWNMFASILSLVIWKLPNLSRDLGMDCSRQAKPVQGPGGRRRIIDSKLYTEVKFNFISQLIKLANPIICTWGFCIFLVT